MDRDKGRQNTERCDSGRSGWGNTEGTETNINVYYVYYYVSM